jgi:hypothetical protein
MVPTTSRLGAATAGGYEPFADQIPKRLRAIFITLASEEKVKLLQEFRFNGDADAA